MKLCSGKLLPLCVTTAMCLTVRFTPALAESSQPGQAGWEQVGQASFYNNRYAGHRTADGTRYDPAAMTAAHQWLPLGTRLKVMRADSDRVVVVTVTDRQTHSGRVLDLSRGAAEQLGIISMGTARVRLIALSSTASPADDAVPQQQALPQTPDRRPGSPRRSRGAVVHVSGHAGMRAGHALAMADRQRRITARHHPAAHLI